MELPPCEFGAKCYRANPKHFQEFSHPWGESGALEGIKAKPSTKRKLEPAPKSPPPGKSPSSQSPKLSSPSSKLGSPPSSPKLSSPRSPKLSAPSPKLSSPSRSPAPPDSPEPTKPPSPSSPPPPASLLADDSDEEPREPVTKKAAVIREEKEETKVASGPAKTMAESLVDPEWRALLAGEFTKPYFRAIETFVAKEREKMPVWPAQNEVFAALNSTPLSKVKVVIIGQDPYFNPGQGHGLCFSVRKGVKRPPSLLRIYKEIERDYPGFVIPAHGFLQEWADRGVLLLNATLTVQQGNPNSHKDCGWQKFTDVIIQHVNEKLSGVVFLLWGGFAQKKGKMVDKKKHAVLNGAHPSPLGGSAWIGCAHFKKANEALVKFGKEPVDWTISP